MSTWNIEYVVPILGDSPLPHQITVELDTQGLDIYGADEQAVLEALRVKAREHGGADAVLTRAVETSD